MQKKPNISRQAAKAQRLAKKISLRILCPDASGSLRVLFIVALILILSPIVSLSQQTRNDSLSKPHNGVAAPLRVVSNPAFSAGEKLTFLVHYGPLVAGNARLSVPEIVNVNGRPCYKIISEMWSNKFFSSMFKIDDRVESHTDVDGLFSWWFSKRLREGDHRNEHVVNFDQINHLAVMEKGGKIDTLAVPPFVQDVLSAIYFLRTMKLMPGDTIHIPNHSDGKLFDLKVVVHKREKVQTKAGKFSCLAVEPFLKTSGLFQQKGRLIIHMTDDQRKMPVMITSQLYVKAFKLGAIVAELEKMEGVPKK